MTTFHTPAPARLAVVAVAWLGATVFGLAVAATTKVGPVVVDISGRHGVHLGDVMAFGVGYLVALVVTAVALEPAFR